MCKSNFGAMSFVGTCKVHLAGLRAGCQVPGDQKASTQESYPVLGGGYLAPCEVGASTPCCQDLQKSWLTISLRWKNPDPGLA